MFPIRYLCVGAALLVTAGVLAVSLPQATVDGQSTMPNYRVDPSWPKPLPLVKDASGVLKQWVTGEVGGGCIDSHDHIVTLNRGFLLQAGGLISADGPFAMAAPPVIIYDVAGNIVTGSAFLSGALRNQMAAAAVCVAEARCSRLEPGRGFQRSAGASAHSAGQGAPVFSGACPSARQPPMHCILVAAPRTLKSRGGIPRRCFPVVRRGRRRRSRRKSREDVRPVCVHFGTVFGSHLRGPRGAARW